ncbi:MAG: potassium/proton antiporter [Glycocaulis sp.]|uniref:potassium/proton antiporter n=1 Tax=Glycocaulis sp. TaxID=1969725 RepID=UPI003F717F44
MIALPCLAPTAYIGSIMDTAELILLAAAGLVLLAIAGAAATRQAGAPLLLIFLVIGMLAGEEGPGGIAFHAHDTAYLFGSLALALILFDGGLGTKLRRLRSVLRPALSLATLGVIITAGITALAAKYLFGLGWVEAALMGAIVSSTDAAAVLMLIAGKDIKARPRVATTLEAESGFNDPMAVILVVTFVAWLTGQGIPDPLIATLSIVWAIVAGGAIGWFGGRLIAYVERKIGLPIGLYPIFASAGAVFLFAFAEVVGGSGFLAAYLAGVAMASAPKRRAAEATARFSDGLAWIAQIGLFLMLGLLVTPSHAAEVALPALGLAFVLILIARPVAVLVCLAPERFRINERAFIGWMGLRGAVPIFLGAFPVLAGVENANLYFSAAFAVVIASLVIQGWTAGPVARLFNVAPPLERGGNLANAGMIAAVAIGFTLASALVSFGANERDAGREAISPLNMRELLAVLGPDGSMRAVRLESFPSDWDAMDPAERRETFGRIAAGLVAAQNERIMEEREQLLVMRAQEEAGIPLSLPQQARRDTLARRYGGRYDDLDDLLARVDIVPPSLGAAQAALATGWGSSAAALERNALYGRTPREGRFSSLTSAAADYVDVFNTHRDFASFRAERARLREQGDLLVGPALVGQIGPYAESGDAYAAQVRAVMNSGGLTRFDPARDAGFIEES